MTEIISVINQKGGVGKSTTALALGQGLAEIHKKKVLFVDLDAQGNLTSTLEIVKKSATVWDVLTGKCEAKEAITLTSTGHVLASNPQLSSADMIITSTGKEHTLKEALEPVQKSYDYIIIDTPPALGILTVNALTASDSVIIPAQADLYSVQGINQLSSTIDVVKKYCNKDLTIKGILLTRYSSRAVLNREIAETLEETAKNLNTKVFSAKIRDAVAVREAQAMKQSLFSYAPKSNATTDYKEFIKEVIK